MKKILFISALFASASVFAQKQLQTETTNMITFASGKIVQLAEAIPSDKYDWSPEEGVRSISGVLQHVISTNYFFGSKLGGTPPEGMNKDPKTKDDLIPALQSSIDFITESIKNVEDDALADKIEFPFPGDYTTTSAILIAFSHCNEHLGQLIAYSRMNGIAPPWSQ